VTKYLQQSKLKLFLLSKIKIDTILSLSLLILITHKNFQVLCNKCYLVHYLNFFLLTFIKIYSLTEYLIIVDETENWQSNSLRTTLRITLMYNPISLWITHDFCIRSSVFFSFLWCRASGNHPTNNLALSATSFEKTVQTVETNRKTD
jgi:hypothetical protein